MVECALKARIARQTERHDFPDKHRAQLSHTHRIKDLVRVAGIEEELEAAKMTDLRFAAHWQMVEGWTELSRYERKESTDARGLLLALNEATRSTAMAKGTLVGLDIELGSRVLAILDAAKFPVTTALWILNEEFDEWRLLLASPAYDKLGSYEAYLRALKALSDVDRNLVTQPPLTLVGNRHNLIRGLRRVFGKSVNGTGIRVVTRSIGDVWIDEAYVYRIR